MTWPCVKHHCCCCCSNKNLNLFLFHSLQLQWIKNIFQVIKFCVRTKNWEANQSQQMDSKMWSATFSSSFYFHIPLPIKLTNFFELLLSILTDHRIACYGYSLHLSMCPPFAVANSKQTIIYKTFTNSREGTRPEDLMVFDNVTLASLLIKQGISSTMLLKRIIVFDLFPRFPLLFSLSSLFILSLNEWKKKTLM